LVRLSHEFNIPVTNSLFDEDYELVALILEEAGKYVTELNDKMRSEMGGGGAGALHDETEILAYLKREKGIV
jgi:hypothetical protein